MITGFTADERKRIRRILRGPHWIRVKIMILDMNHESKGDLTNRLLSGQVDYDTTAEVTRTAEIVVSDPNSALSINPDSPAKGALFMNRMIRIVYMIAPSDKSEWFSIPLITGPITGLSRDGLTVNVKIAGKDHLGYASVWNPISKRKGFKITDLIVLVLREIMGESKFQVPNHKKTLGKELSINGESVPWAVIQKLAGALHNLAFYDGRGVFRLRAFSKRPVWTFTENDLISEPNFTYDPSTICNAVVVEGGKPKGAKKKPRARVVAPKTHPLSPQKLGRKVTWKEDGEEKEKIVPRYYVKRVQDSSIKTKRGCKKLAQQILDRALLESINVEMETIPIPMFEEYDTYKVETADVQLSARMTQWSFPLTHDGNMSVGVIKKVSLKKRATKKRPKGRNRGRRG